MMTTTSMQLWKKQELSASGLGFNFRVTKEKINLEGETFRSILLLNARTLITMTIWFSEFLFTLEI